MHDSDPKRTDTATAVFDGAGLGNGFRIGLARFSLEHAAVQLRFTTDLPAGIQPDECAKVGWCGVDESGMRSSSSASTHNARLGPDLQ